MKKAELVAKVAEKGNMTKKDAEVALNAVFGAVTDALAAGEDVQVLGFGSFVVRDRAAREARNPATGAVVAIPATKVPAFKASTALKKVVAE